MKSVLGILVLLVSSSSFGATLNCGIDIYADGVQVEKLRINEVEVTNVGGGAQILISSDKRFMFQMGATYQEANDPRLTSTRLAIHVTDLKNKTTNSLMTWFNETQNNFVFEGGDHTDAQTYVGKCSIKF